MADELTWYNVADEADYQQLLNNLREGDLLEIKRTPTYCHWAVCVSIGEHPEVVHRTGPAGSYFAISGVPITSTYVEASNLQWSVTSPIISRGTATSNIDVGRSDVADTISAAAIARADLWDVLLDDQQNPGEVRINNSKDREHQPQEVHKIIETALMSVTTDDSIDSYDLFKNNCEHFAYYCRYGKALSSSQVVSTVAKVTFGALAVVGVVGIGAFAICNPGAAVSIACALYRVTRR